MTIPIMYFFGEQSFLVAHSYWMCGDNIVRNTIPPRWIGLCTLVRMRVPAVVLYNGINDILNIEKKAATLNRRKRQVDDSVIYTNVLGIPAGIPDEFKAQSEITAGLESILPWITINKNVQWINYIYYNQQRFANITSAIFHAFGSQLHAASIMAQQNRQVLDWLTADKAGVCHMFGKHCCTFIPNNTAPDGIFSVAMDKLTKLKSELRESAGKGNLTWDWLDQILGKWGAVLAKAGISALIVLILVLFLTCCVIPILKRRCVRAMDKQMMVVAGLQRAQMLNMMTPMQMAQICAKEAGNGKTPDLFPLPDSLQSSDEDDQSVD